MPSNRLAAAALALLLLPLAGCHIVAAGALAGGAIGVATTPPSVTMIDGPYQPDAAIMLDFTPARAIVATSARGRADTLQVPDVTRLVGRIRIVRGDTLWLSVTELRRPSGGPIGYGRGREPVAGVVLDGAVRATVIATRADVRERFTIGVALGAVLALIGILAYCSSERCLE